MSTWDSDLAPSLRQLADLRTHPYSTFFNETERCIKLNAPGLRIVMQQKTGRNEMEEQNSVRSQLCTPWLPNINSDIDQDRALFLLVGNASTKNDYPILVSMVSSGLLLRHLTYRPWHLKARPGGIRYPVSSTLHLRSSSSPKVTERGENLFPRPSNFPICYCRQ